MRGAPEAVVADLGAAAWQDVLEEPLEKLDAGERDAARLVRPIVLIANVTSSSVIASNRLFAIAMRNTYRPR